MKFVLKTMCFIVKSPVKENVHCWINLYEGMDIWCPSHHSNRAYTEEYKNVLQMMTNKGIYRDFHIRAWIVWIVMLNYQIK